MNSPSAARLVVSTLLVAACAAPMMSAPAASAPAPAAPVVSAPPGTAVVPGESIAPSRSDRPFQEAVGLVVIEAEHYHAVHHPQCWKELPSPSGTAMKVLEGPWSRHLRYDIRFTTPGTYRVYVFGRKNPLAAQYQGNDLKVCFYPAEAKEQKTTPGFALYEIGFGEQKEFGWRGTPKTKDKLPATTDVKVPQPGVYRLYIVGGAGEEAGWEIDRLLLTRDNAQPPAGTVIGPAESRR